MTKKSRKIVGFELSKASDETLAIVLEGLLDEVMGRQGLRRDKRLTLSMGSWRFDVDTQGCKSSDEGTVGGQDASHR